MAEITEWVKKVWKNRITEFPTRRTLTKEDGSSEIVTVTRNEGTVSEEGDAFDADTMNNLEERIDAGFTEVNRKLEQKISFNIKEYIFSVVASSEPTIKNIDENDAFILSGYLEFQNQQLAIGYSSGGSTLKFQYIPSEKSIKVYSAWTGVIHVFIGYTN